MYLQQNTWKCCRHCPEPSRLTSVVLLANNSFRACSSPATLHVRLSFISKAFPIEVFPIMLNEISGKDLGNLLFFDCKNNYTVCKQYLKPVNCLGFLPVHPLRVTKRFFL